MTRAKDTNRPEARSSFAEASKGAKAISFDPAAYRRFMADCDWTDAQKDEFTKSLWEIVLGFVDLGFDLSPVQQAVDKTKTLELDSPSVVPSKSNTDICKETVAQGAIAPPARRMDS